MEPCARPNHLTLFADAAGWKPGRNIVVLMVPPHDGPVRLDAFRFNYRIARRVLGLSPGAARSYVFGMFAAVGWTVTSNWSPRWMEACDATAA